MPNVRSALLIVLALLCAAHAYAPGLRGGYVFDDFPNIVENTALHVTTTDAAAWKKAAWASPASDLQRPLASLTFAANHFFSGLEPLPMKATNLAIHLLNGLLSYLLLCRIIARARDVPEPDSRERTMAALVVALWLLHPINLTAVLFVVQRMESLAQTFVLAGLLCYVGARERQRQQRRGSGYLLWIGVPACTVLGIASKESAALLPLYALILEFTVLHQRDTHRKALAAFFAIFLVIPAIVGLAWMLPRVLSADAYAQRYFTLGQRLLTEPRVLLDYIGWILLPLPGAFSLFRDDFAASVDLLHPWTTLPAIVVVAGLLAGALAVRNRAPLVSLGLLWFFAAHALTATVFPLELAFEHRNYFASLAMILCAVAIASRALGGASFASVRPVLAAGALALCAFTLVLRANDWSDPVRLALTEAGLHPQSPRATYELGRAYVVLSGYRADSVNVDRAIESLEAAARVPQATILPEVALITVASHTHRPIDDAWWDAIRDKLGRKHPTVADSEGVLSLTECQRAGECTIDDQRMLEIYLAGLRHGRPDPAILSSYAIFAFNRMHDTELALRLARGAVSASGDPQYRINLANFLLDLGQVAAAREEIDRLRSSNRLGALDSSIDALEHRLSEVSSPTGSH
jgi:hypothetical protein